MASQTLNSYTPSREEHTHTHARKGTADKYRINPKHQCAGAGIFDTSTTILELLSPSLPAGFALLCMYFV